MSIVLTVKQRFRKKFVLGCFEVGKLGFGVSLFGVQYSQRHIDSFTFIVLTIEISRLFAGK